MRTWKQRSRVISAQTQILWHWQCPEDHSPSSKEVVYFLQGLFLFQFIPLNIYEAQEGSEESALSEGNRMLGLLVLPRIGGLQEDFCNLTVCAHWLSQLQWLDIFNPQNKKLHMPKLCFSDFFFPRSLALCCYLFFWAETIRCPRFSHQHMPEKQN